MKIEKKYKNLPPAMLGTAGHVDHGKTSLVKLLTGCDTDQLKEEKERGLSINLGFAPCQLSGERMVGIVDVPGHIDFIRNMVTGAASIDLLILVVAADDGIMPQTVEHLQIIKMLSFPKLIVALTKIDLVDEEMVELAKEEIGEFLDDMGFYDVPVMPVSNITLDGISALKSRIEEFAGGLEDRRDNRKFRMNIQRHFSVKGLGTVVTGIPLSGELHLNDPLELLPAGKKSSVRGIQNYKQKTEHTSSKICCALNIRDIEDEDLKRGMALVAPDAYKPTDSAIVAIDNISKKFILKHNYSLRFHSGTFEASVKVSIIGTNRLGPLESGFAKLIFTEPVTLGAGDRFILRESSPSMTIGGGRIILPELFRFKRSSDEFYLRLRAAKEFLEENDYLATQLIVAGSPLQSRDKILYYSALETAEAEKKIEKKVADGFLCDLSSDTYLVLSRISEVQDSVMKMLNTYHNSHKYSWGIDPTALGVKFDLKKQSATALIKLLVKSCQDLRFSHGRLALKSFKPAISDKQIKYKDAIAELIVSSGFDCIAKGSILNTLGIPEKEFKMLTNILVEEGTVTVLGKHYMSKQCFEQALVKLRQLAEEHDIIDIKEYRDLLGTGRNITVIILEKFDSLGITRRVDEGRKMV
jgi:selenocysteine-specific elongation factor